LGLVLLTKTTVYAMLAVALLAVLICCRLQGRTWVWAVEQVAWVYVPALLIAMPWLIRNACIYGWNDPLALARHNAVVEGQPRSAEWLARYGWNGLLINMARTTFQSFWGQFGWMGVVLPQRHYLLLALFTILVSLGFMNWLRTCSGLSQTQRGSLVLLLALFTLTLLEFIGYNLTFVQHQGRYLYPALVPIGLAAALGIDNLSRLLPERLRHPAVMLLFTGLAVFDLYCLFKFIVPFLRG